MSQEFWSTENPTINLGVSLKEAEECWLRLKWIGHLLLLSQKTHCLGTRIRFSRFHSKQITWCEVQERGNWLHAHLPIIPLIASPSWLTILQVQIGWYRTYTTYETSLIPAPLCTLIFPSISGCISNFYAPKSTRFMAKCMYIYIYTCQMRLRIWGSPTFEGSPFVQNKNMWNGWCYTETTSILLKSIGILVYQTWNVGFLKTLGKPSRWSPKSLRSRSFTRKHAKAMWFCAVTGRRIFRCMWICYSKFMEINSTFESFLVHFGAIKSIDIICNLKIFVGAYYIYTLED